MSNATEQVTQTASGTVITTVTTVIDKYRFTLRQFTYTNGITYFKAYYNQMRDAATYGQTYDCNYAGYDAVLFTSWNHKEMELLIPSKKQKLESLVTETFLDGKFTCAERVFTTRELAQAAINKVIIKKKLA